MTEENNIKPDNAVQNNGFESNSRREFLKNVGLLGVGVFVGSISKYFGKRLEKGKSNIKSNLRTKNVIE